MTIDYKSIGRKIKAHRTKHRMTQAELAEKTGMSDVYISNIETGQKRTSLDALLKIIYVLNISLDSVVLESSAVRLPKALSGFEELLSDCDIDECELILKTASAYKKILREERRKR